MDIVVDSHNLRHYSLYLNEIWDFHQDLFQPLDFIDSRNSGWSLNNFLNNLLSSHYLLNFWLNGDNLFDNSWNFSDNFLDIRNYSLYFDKLFVDNNLFLNYLYFFLNDHLLSNFHNLFHYLWNLNDFLRNLSDWNQLFDYSVNWNCDLYRNNDVPLNFNHLSSIVIKGYNSLHFHDFRDLFNDLNGILFNSLFKNNFFLNSSLYNQFVINYLNRLWYFNIDYSLFLYFYNFLLNYRNCHSPFDFSYHFSNDLFLNYFFYYLGNLYNFFNNSWNYYYFLDYFFYLNYFWNLNHLLNNLFDLYSNLFYSLYNFRNFNYFLLNLIHYSWHINVVINNFLDLNNLWLIHYYRFLNYDFNVFNRFYSPNHWNFDYILYYFKNLISDRNLNAPLYLIRNFFDLLDYMSHDLLNLFDSLLNYDFFNYFLYFHELYFPFDDLYNLISKHGHLHDSLYNFLYNKWLLNDLLYNSMLDCDMISNLDGWLILNYWNCHFPDFLNLNYFRHLNYFFYNLLDNNWNLSDDLYDFLDWLYDLPDDLDLFWLVLNVVYHLLDLDDTINFNNLLSDHLDFKRFCHFPVEIDRPVYNSWNFNHSLDYFLNVKRFFYYIDNYSGYL